MSLTILLIFLTGIIALLGVIWANHLHRTPIQLNSMVNQGSRWKWLQYGGYYFTWQGYVFILLSIIAMIGTCRQNSQSEKEISKKDSLINEKQNALNEAINLNNEAIRLNNRLVELNNMKIDTVYSGQKKSFGKVIDTLEFVAHNASDAVVSLNTVTLSLCNNMVTEIERDNLFNYKINFCTGGIKEVKNVQLLFYLFKGHGAHSYYQLGPAFGESRKIPFELINGVSRTFKAQSESETIIIGSKESLKENYAILIYGTYESFPGIKAPFNACIIWDQDQWRNFEYINAKIAVEESHYFQFGY